jgi:CheY-like chemotaxis protein
MKKVLIVDDDDEIRALLQDLLQEEGFRVGAARDGREALAILQREGGWVVLLDIMMPNVDGRQVVRELEQNQRLLNSNRVALMSAGGRLAQERHHLDGPVVRAFIPKPFDLDEVLDVVQQLAS